MAQKEEKTQQEEKEIKNQNQEQQQAFSKEERPQGEAGEENKEAKKAESIAKSEYVKLKYQFSEFVNQHKEYEKEFENYKRRTREEIANAKLDGMTKAINAILPALDAFKKAKKIITDKSSISGINLIEKNILTQLEKLGVKKIECVGEKFDTNFHNAVMATKSNDAEPNTVIEEVEAGFTLNDKVIKFSQVIVAK